MYKYDDKVLKNQKYINCVITHYLNQTFVRFITFQFTFLVSKNRELNNEAAFKPFKKLKMSYILNLIFINITDLG